MVAVERIRVNVAAFQYSTRHRYRQPILGARVKILKGARGLDKRREIHDCDGDTTMIVNHTNGADRHSGQLLMGACPTDTTLSIHRRRVTCGTIDPPDPWPDGEPPRPPRPPQWVATALWGRT